MIVFNDRFINLKCLKLNMLFIVYIMKRNMVFIELKIIDRIFYVNYYEGMICIKKKLWVNNEVDINVLLIFYEYYYKYFIYYNFII